jgi:hypothetical protein
MKQGRTLTELAAELERQAASKRDFVADTRTMEFGIDGIAENAPFLQVEGAGAFPLNKNASVQIAQRLDIPQKYYDRMAKEAPGLLANNVNTWFQQKPERRMVRTLDGNARAFLSDRYQRRDNFELAQAVLPVLMEAQNGITVESSEVTEDRFYLKFASPRIEGEVRKGDVLQAGGIVRNSEVGKGSLAVFPFLKRLVCDNGMTVEEFGKRSYHVGRRVELEDDATELYSDATMRADDAAFWGKIADLVRAVTEQAGFDKILDRLRQTTEFRLADPVKVVELTAQRLGLVETERTGVLTALLKADDLTAYGLIQAITETSKHVPDYDRASELEAFGGDLLTLDKGEWREIAAAK